MLQNLLTKSSLLAGLVAATGTSFLFADTTTTASSASAAPAVTATAAAPASGGSIFGELDIRPTVTGTDGSSVMETSVEAGYNFHSNLRLTYAAAFDTNITNLDRDLGFKLYNGFVRLRVRNILQSADKSSALNFQARLYTPTDAAEREKGFLTTARAYATFTKKFSDSLSVSVSEVPMLHAYTKAGLGNKANKGIFENMIVMDATIKIVGPLSLYVPIIYQLAKYQDFKAGASRNGAWVSTLWTWPELGYAINDNNTVGLSFRSANMVTENLSNLTMDKAFKDGAAQLFWTANL